MKKTLIFGLAVLVCSLVVWPQKNDSAVNEIATAEKAFAAMAAAKGTRAAFLEFAAPDAIVFDTKPENAREVWEKKLANQSLLAWAPTLADASADGSMGYTTGNWEFRPKGASDLPVAWGEYFTIWKKQLDGKWKFELDIGVSHDSAQFSTDWKSSAPVKKGANSQNATWQSVELDFSETLRTERANGVYQKLAADNIYLLRDGKLPIVGKKTALEQIIPKENFTLKTKVLGGGAASDFIYAYGQYASALNNKNETGFFVRVWKHEPQGWRIALDLAHPVLPESK
jgi:ketosteroid isomerase-like protein